MGRSCNINAHTLFNVECLPWHSYFCSWKLIKAAESSIQLLAAGASSFIMRRGGVQNGTLGSSVNQKNNCGGGWCLEGPWGAVSWVPTGAWRQGCTGSLWQASLRHLCWAEGGLEWNWWGGRGELREISWAGLARVARSTRGQGPSGLRTGGPIEERGRVDWVVLNPSTSSTIN